MVKEIGKLEEKRSSEEMELHWQIPNFLSLENDYYSASNFKFLNINWRLKIDPFEYDSPSNTNSYLVALLLQMVDTKFSYNIMCTFGIKKADGSLTGIRSFKHTFCHDSSEFRASRFLARIVLQACSSELMPSNNLTILCKLEHLSGSLKWRGLDTLSENIKCCFTNKELCDITLQLQDKEFLAHRFILAARSPVFAAMFRHETSEKQTGIINVPDCDPESFQEFLDYLYSGKLENISCVCAPHLYKIADKYDVQELKMYCVEYMSQNLKIENFFDVVLLAEEYEETNLFAGSQSFFNKNLKEIFESDEWMAFLKRHVVLANKLLIEMASKHKFC